MRADSLLSRAGRWGVVLPFFLVTFCGNPSYSSAGAGRPLFRFTQGGRAGLRDERLIHSELLSRMELGLIDRGWWRVTPFSEVRWDIDGDLWSRVELGGEIGFQPFSWLYLGQGVHQAWLSPDRDRPEWEIRTLFSLPISFLRVGSKPLGIYLLGEYTYDLKYGKGIRNEMGAGLKIPLPFPRLTAFLGWRHVDLIHLADMDQLEGSLQAQF